MKSSVEFYSLVSSLLGLMTFFSLVLVVALANAKPLFLSFHGWSHRLSGAALMVWLLVGAIQTATSMMSGTMTTTPSQQQQQQWLFLYDTVLGLLGITTTLTAARDFPHKYVQNAMGQSGSLSNKALVTQAEMIEHSFYQALNLLQAWYLHYMSSIQQRHRAYYFVSDEDDTINRFQRLLALWLVTSPWLVRHRFPVHSFSHNWKITPKHQRTAQEVILYRIKKGQYIFYKHVLLHGLNISMALEEPAAADESRALILVSPSWRIYWLALNTSYVMEFFLQTMVRRRLLSVPNMFALQRLLMVVSSIAATMILVQKQLVQASVCIVSLALNIVHRGHDVMNVLLTTLIFYCLSKQIQ